MDITDEARRRLAQVARRYRRAKANLTALHNETTAALKAARLAGLTPTEVERLSPLSPSGTRTALRRDGIPRPASGPGSKPKTKENQS